MSVFDHVYYPFHHDHINTTRKHPPHNPLWTSDGLGGVAWKLGGYNPPGGLDKSLGCVVLGVGQRAPFPSAKGFGEALWARTTGFKAETRPPIGFLLFSALRTLSYCLLWIPKKTFKNSYPIQYLSQLLYIWWCYVMFLVYETYFTSESRKRWSLGGGLDTFGREIPVRNVYMDTACYTLWKCVSLLNVLFLNS